MASRVGQFKCRLSGPKLLMPMLDISYNIYIYMCHLHSQSNPSNVVSSDISPEREAIDELRRVNLFEVKVPRSRCGCRSFGVDELAFRDSMLNVLV